MTPVLGSAFWGRTAALAALASHPAAPTVRAAVPLSLIHIWVLLMETNYRSTGAIVSRADAFIQGNRDRHSKHMRTDNQAGAPIRRVSLSDYSRQAAYLLQVAKDCRTSTAVLYRNNDSALPLIDLLEREGAPYVCRQREGFFFTSPIVRDLTDVLTLAYRPDDRERFLRICWKLDQMCIRDSPFAGRRCV